MAVSNGQVWQLALYCEQGMLDKYLNWELTGRQIHKYAAHKYSAKSCKIESDKGYSDTAIYARVVSDGQQ